MSRSFFIFLFILAGAIFLAFNDHTIVARPNTSGNLTQEASSTIPLQTASTTNKASTATVNVIKATATSSTPKKPAVTPKNTANPALPQQQPQVARISDPYPFPPDDPTALNEVTRAALVNILCLPQGSGEGISGSGVIIDPRGVILTNAHVAQYVLLAESEKIDLSCTVRTGSPAQAQWRVTTLYIPPIWVGEHATDLNSNVHPTGTGEHDYALLGITTTLDGSNSSSAFPYLPIDTRANIGFTDDQILVASYPAEFSRVTAQNGFYSASSFTTIKQLMTFGSGSVDVYSLGGIIEAQNGSSGGAVVNDWGRLIGIVVTTSVGQTTSERDLHALTLNYIDRDMSTQTGKDLGAFLMDIYTEAANFNTDVAPSLIQKFLSAFPQ